MAPAVILGGTMGIRDIKKTDSILGKKSLIDFYKRMLEQGRIKEGGAAYKRYQQLNEISPEHHKKRLREFLKMKNKRKE